MDNQQVSTINEVWKVYSEVPRFEVSTLGNVRHSKDGSTKYKKPDKIGYIYIQYKVKGKRLNLKVHRMVAKTFLSNELNLPEVNHKDGNKQNNNINNLEWCTRQQNIRHGYDTGLFDQKGSKNGRSILTETQVHELCAWYEASTEHTPKLAVETFNVSIQQASKIRCGVAWKHISCLYNIVPLR